MVSPGGVPGGPCLLCLEPGPIPQSFSSPPPPQLSCYDQAKQLVLSTGYLSDGVLTHFVASFIAVSAGLAVGAQGEAGAQKAGGCGQVWRISLELRT